MVGKDLITAGTGRRSRAMVDGVSNLTNMGSRPRTRIVIRRRTDTKIARAARLPRRDRLMWRACINHMGKLRQLHRGPQIGFLPPTKYVHPSPRYYAIAMNPFALSSRTSLDRRRHNHSPLHKRPPQLQQGCPGPILRPLGVGVPFRSRSPYTHICPIRTIRRYLYLPRDVDARLPKPLVLTTRLLPSRPDKIPVYRAASRSTNE